ncbi:MAG TPA: DNA internalization-related competence protein ComEC/Rec2 [Burkholderiaceae bacterium]|mgnify:CR=1 FL=1|jgi:competence protein ComEC|nr:DNA internalization-related competence protein ComEC/Rec2 [Burkholderiaceae bacterium]
MNLLRLSWLRSLGHVPPGAWVVLCCWWVQQLTVLPSRAACVGLIAAGALALLARGALLGCFGRRMAIRVWSLRAARRLSRRTAAALLFGVAAAVLATAHAVWRAHLGLAERLAPELEGVELVVTGVVDEMPTPAQFGWRTRFRIESCEPGTLACPGPILIRLNWPGDAGGAGSRGGRGDGPGAGSTDHSAELSADGAVPPCRAGERWRLTVRLRRALSPQNPGLFDGELRALEEGVSAQGSVRDGARTAVRPHRIDAFDGRARSAIERLRTALRDAMMTALPDSAASVRGVLIALVVGDQSAIPGRAWAQFNRTGVGHLMSISGLHITMLAGMAVWLVRRLWRGRLIGLMAAPRAAWLGGLVVAFGYSALAGWGLPAQRTCWMLAAGGLALLSGRTRAALPVLCTAAAIVCAGDPWAPMAAGFWLSFGAVAAIIWHGAPVSPGQPTVEDSPVTEKPRPHWVARLKARALPWLAAAGQTQVAATIAMLPLGVLFFSSVSLVSPLANALAIPVVSGLVTPLALAGGFAGLLWPSAAAGLLSLAAWLTDGLLAALTVSDGFGWASLGLPAPSAAAGMLAVLACVVLLAPWPVPGRAWAGAGLLPLMLGPIRAPPPDELWLTALDVGQGMAVLVETADGRLMYDSGPAYGEDNDAGARVLLPYLRARGIDRLQALVVSHRDTDHSGGALSLMGQMPIDWLASSLGQGHPVVQAAPRHHPCRRGDEWRWGKVHFQWLHPGDPDASDRRASSNSRSCVLRIASPAGTVLLAGDIEAAQEKSLIASLDASALHADVLLVPHHGSATSSTWGFLQAVAPTWAVFQVGYRNRFKHPADKVLQRYVRADIGILRTDHDGAITLRLRAGEPAAVERHRRDSGRYWRLAGAVEAAPPDEAGR